jgi:hypothetical protein
MFGLITITMAAAQWPPGDHNTASGCPREVRPARRRQPAKLVATPQTRALPRASALNLTPCGLSRLTRFVARHSETVESRREAPVRKNIRTHTCDAAARARRPAIDNHRPTTAPIMCRGSIAEHPSRPRESTQLEVEDEGRPAALSKPHPPWWRERPLLNCETTLVGEAVLLHTHIKTRTACVRNNGHQVTTTQQVVAPQEKCVPPESRS